MTELVRQWGTWLDASGWAAVLGFVASLVGIAGVPFAVVKAWQANTAAQAARAAAEATTTRIGLLDAVRRLSSILTRLDELHERLGVDEPRILARPLREQRRGLIYLAEAGSLSSAPDQAILRDTIVTLRDVEAQLTPEATLDTGPATVALRAQLAERLDELHSALERLGRRATEVDHGK